MLSFSFQKQDIYTLVLSCFSVIIKDDYHIDLTPRFAGEHKLHEFVDY